MIYKYFDGKFVAFQCIKATGAEQWHAITDDAGDMMLLALTAADGVTFYEYDGWLFTPTEFQSRGQFTSGASIFGITSVLWDGDYIIGVAQDSETL